MVRQPASSMKKAVVTVYVTAPEDDFMTPYTIRIDGTPYTPPAAGSGGSITVTSGPGGRILMPKPTPPGDAFFSIQTVRVDGADAFYGEDDQMRDYEYVIPIGKSRIQVTAYAADEDIGMPTYGMEIVTGE